MTTIAARLRARAQAIRADALELEAMAEEIERGASVPWLTIKQAADELGVKEHVLRDAGRREELVLGKAGRTSMVQRSALEKWLLSSPAPKAPRLVKADDTKAEARVAILNAARRAG